MLYILIYTVRIFCCRIGPHNVLDKDFKNRGVVGYVPSLSRRLGDDLIIGQLGYA